MKYKPEYKCEFLDIVGDKCGVTAQEFRLISEIIPVCDRCSRIYLLHCPVMSEEEYLVQQIMGS